ncbi:MULTISPECIES: alpha/beta fold hydrolase [Bradyrhizobium]|jgi:pimeloyl-ACP methyl ester carboxylesterase|uniref:alpha/beta fold hydrolase n=1 Tax=Bradyrhizobium TaxID=374 RepID=UPI0004121E30|nr:MULTISPECIES: alpha/beta hydrolase [Bradyrhizobium]MBR0882611.1 alpha/beta hydrolase [Bradyrhizobium liaoningense]MBR1001903.1 alpha/beta hydrolase [Bradyrhizobium liaoningense]MBR1068372.1 alpha/beta hydrolase [Bradyrhizobium liaoningense]
MNPRAAFASVLSESHRHMTSLFATSSDGSRIAYERAGSGPAIVLLHGGMQSRQVWHAAGYVSELQSDFTVLAIDIRGHGDSERPRDSIAYSVDRHCDDILAVVDHACIERFMLWGYSYGANIGRYLAARSRRVLRFVMVGIPFGPGAVGEFRSTITGVRDRWAPILKAQEEGSLDVEALTPPERAYLQSGRAGPEVAWLAAMLDWEDIDPGRLLCPTLWIVGRENPAALGNAQTIGTALQSTKVQLVILDGLTHEAELSAVDLVLPRVRQFLHVGSSS